MGLPYYLNIAFSNMFWPIRAITKRFNTIQVAVSEVYIYNCMKVVYTLTQTLSYNSIIYKIKTQCSFLFQ
jgi:hypothetical protein